MSISPDARISLLDSFGGASASVDGIRGGVPAPSAGQQSLFLRGDGTWAAAGGGSGTTAAALNTADSLTAGTRAHKRMAIGSQTFSTTAVTGTLTAPVAFDFRPPLFVEPGTVFDVILKIPSATNTATAGLGYRGTVAITGNFE